MPTRTRPPPSPQRSGRESWDLCIWCPTGSPLPVPTEGVMVGRQENQRGEHLHARDTGSSGFAVSRRAGRNLHPARTLPFETSSRPGRRTQFLTSLAVQRHVAASTQNQALAALLFLLPRGARADPALGRRHRARPAAGAPARRHDTRRGPCCPPVPRRHPAPHGPALLRRRPAPARRCAPPRPGCRLRSQPDRRPERQGGQASDHDAPGRREGGPRAPSRGGTAPAPARSRRRSRVGRTARRPRPEVPERRP
jgi:hypothetical protein